MGGDSEGMAGPDGAVGRAWVIAPPSPAGHQGPLQAGSSHSSRTNKQTAQHTAWPWGPLQFLSLLI